MAEQVGVLSSSREQLSQINFAHSTQFINNKKRKAPSQKFSLKLRELLSYEQLSEAISWNCDGTIVEIRNADCLTNEVLPMFFKIKTVSNFIRKLNLIGFKKIRSYALNNVKAFINPLFRRDSVEGNNQTSLLSESKSLAQEHQNTQIVIDQLQIISKSIAHLSNTQAEIKLETEVLQLLFKKLDVSIYNLELIISLLIEYASSSGHRQNIQVKEEERLDLINPYSDLTNKNLLLYSNGQMQDDLVLFYKQNFSQSSNLIIDSSYEQDNSAVNQDSFTKSTSSIAKDY